MMKINSKSMRLGLSVALCLLLTACLENSSGAKKTTTSNSSTGSDAINNVVTGGGTYSIVRATVGTSATGSGSGLSLTVSFNASNSNSLLNVCNTTGSKPCSCKFVWNETNNTSGAAVTIPHTAVTNVTSVQQALVGCSTPTIWQTEIPDNTSVTLTVIPNSGNTSSFNVPGYAFTKGSSVVQPGDFSDSVGLSYVNVIRYSCYEQRMRGMSLLNKTGDGSSVTNFNYLSSSQFCLRNLNGQQTPSDSHCGNVPPTSYSSQSYYYNLYIPSNESGQMNLGNQVFVCPTVAETLNEEKDGAGNVISGTQGKYWPMDSSFALSPSITSNYTVGIEANSKTSNLSDPNGNKNTDCAGNLTSPDNNSPNVLLSSCLGFAAQPKPDGTCPLINGLQTYRLRRYVAVYPPIYDTNGSYPKNEAQRLDAVYVLDRPVVDASGKILKDTNGNAFSMLGPKPCPFSYFDAQNVSGTGSTYYGTNNAVWSGKNVDNIFFPYQDIGNGQYGNSCAATLPIANANQNKVSLTTLTAKRYIRPQNAWSPHYEEDTGFLACAPRSSVFRDPPLHFAMNGANMAWCAEAYPSQNDNAVNLNNVKNYTSHTVKNSAGGGTCPWAPSSTSAHSAAYPNAATCDRTVINSQVGSSWIKFPLLAPDTDVEAALKSDPSFDCAMTYDAGGGKVNSADFTKGKSPTQGCCANVTPGLTGAHLEPSIATGAGSLTSSCVNPLY